MDMKLISFSYLQNVHNWTLSEMKILNYFFKCGWAKVGGKGQKVMPFVLILDCNDTCNRMLAETEAIQQPIKLPFIDLSKTDSSLNIWNTFAINKTSNFYISFHFIQLQGGVYIHIYSPHWIFNHITYQSYNKKRNRCHQQTNHENNIKLRMKQISSTDGHKSQSEKKDENEHYLFFKHLSLSGIKLMMMQVLIKLYRE